MHSIIVSNMSDYWFLVPGQSQWLNLNSKASSGSGTGKEVIPMFPYLKISPFILCWIQLGLLFDELGTSALHITTR